MQRNLLLAATLATLTASAFAQVPPTTAAPTPPVPTAATASNVTIYGRFNTSVENIKLGGGDDSWQLVNNASRIGFRGVEDLGGGLRAGFQLEHGFDVDTGTSTSGGQFWARQSEVNLGSNAFGSVRLGNYISEAYYATADYVSLHNHDTGTSADRLYAYVGRNINKVGYRSPVMGGLRVDASVSLDEDVAADRSYDLAVNYDIGSLHLGAGYEKNGAQRQFAVSALYGMGPLMFGGYIQRDRNGFADPTTGIIGGLGDRTSLRLVGMYTVGLSEFHLNVGYADDYDNLDNTDATQITLAYNHNLSKRTKLFAFITKLNDDGGVYGGDLRSVALGVRHNF